MAIYTAWEMERINSEHEPKLDLKIARYISCNKLESMLSSNTLFFCNAFNFEDKYEGEIPLSFFEGWSKESEKNYRQFNILKNKVYVPYVSCWTPYQPGNKKMWAEYAGEDENKDGVCIVMTVRQLVICAAARGGRVYQIHYLNEDGNLGTGDIPFYIPNDEERKQFDLPHAMRVFHALKKHEFEKENEIRSIIYKREKEAGLEVPFKFNLFVENIILNPLATAEQSNAIQQLADKYSVSKIVKSESSL